MRKIWLIILISMGLVVGGGSPAIAEPFLYDWASNVDGTVGQTGDDTLFDFRTGLGTINYTVSGGGGHFVGLFVDHEFSEGNNSYSNEFGNSDGTLGAGQSWEIDEPDYYFGDIYSNFTASDASASALDNSSNLPHPGLADDFSMALGWNFSLAADDEAVISFLVSDEMIGNAFFLTQFDSQSGEQLFFSSVLTIIPGGGGGEPVPEPATMLLLGTGLVGIAFNGRKRFNKK